MMRLQRGLLRSDGALAETGAGGDGSVFGLFFAVAFVVEAGEAVAGDVAAGGAVACCIESDAGVAGGLAATPAAETAGDGSDLGAMTVEDCDSPTVLSDAGGTAACFGAGGVTVGSIVV
jgi:hypothetical protein